MNKDGLPTGVYTKTLASGKIRYKSEVWFERKRHYLGSYETPEEAHAAFILKRSELRGDKSILVTEFNKPKRIYHDRNLTKEIKNALSGTVWNGLLI
jgi:hypothetical protein